ncbi:MAG: acyltransferase [Bacteroidaceae bacterium]|nr:acyltransferase [Bacteroidaceae bacterium]
MKKDRKFWIDAIKAICMICVYVYHTGYYYGIDYNKFVFIFTPFYVNGFFFISGYLFFKSYDKKHLYGKKEYIKSIKNILFRLVIPTIFFSACLYIPKHWGAIIIDGFIINTLGGTGFWFTSAMCVSQIVLATFFLSNRKNIWIYFLFATTILATMNIFGDIRSKPAEEYFPWYWQTGLIYIFVMCLGGIYYKYEESVYKLISKPFMVLLITVAYAVIIYYSLIYPTYYFSLSGRNNMLGIIGMVISILLLISITTRIKESRLLHYIGKNSIVFYFLSGAVPTAVSVITNSLIEEKSYIIYTCVTIVSLAVSCGITYIITHYMPFILDLRNIWNTK